MLFANPGGNRDRRIC